VALETGCNTTLDMHPTKNRLKINN